MVVVDYYLLRKAQLNVPDLSNVRDLGLRAALGPYSWFIGVLVAGAIYFGVSGGRSRLVGSGEPAA